MEMARRNDHSSRRPQQRRLNNAENSSDIDGTAHRVASVTLNNTESDSRTSADVPMYSLRSKRRKKLPRREKQAIGTVADMEVDEHQPPWKKLSVNTPDNGLIPTCKVQMDWDHGEGSSTIDNVHSIRSTRRSALDMENNQSDQFSLSDSEDSTSNIDADDEQSDWPGNELACRPPLPPSLGPFQLVPPPPRVALISQKDAALSAEAIKRIEQFLQNSDDSELLLDKVYRTSAVKQMLRRQSVVANVQIVKRGRGTVALKKL